MLFVFVIIFIKSSPLQMWSADSVFTAMNLITARRLKHNVKSLFLRTRTECLAPRQRSAEGKHECLQGEPPLGFHSQ